MRTHDKSAFVALFIKPSIIASRPNLICDSCDGVLYKCIGDMVCIERQLAAVFKCQFTGICKDEAKFSRKEPQPEEQASLTTILVIMPLSIQMAFIS